MDSAGPVVEGSGGIGIADFAVGPDQSLRESEAPTQITSKTFRAWIPNVSGRLSFSVVGECEKAISANVADGGVRYIAAHQFRNASDVILPFRNLTAPFLFGIEGRIAFVLLARTEPEGQRQQYLLRGRAFIFAQPPKWKKVVRPALEPHWQRLNEYQHLEHGSLEAYARNSHDNATDFCTKSCSFYVDVCIRRSGTTDIVFPPSMQLPVDAPLMPEEPIKKDHILQVIASQLFFFLKDLGHRHQHHDQKTDQLVLLHEFQPTDDTSWREGTLYSMFRKIIEIKRDPHITTFSNSLGIIAYADAFGEISKEELKAQGIEYVLPTYYAKQMSDSIKATQSRVEREFNAKQRSSDTMRTTIIAVASVVFSFIGLIKLTSHVSTVEPHWAIVWLLEGIVTDPGVAIIAIIMIVAFVLSISALLRGETPKYYIWAMRLLQWLPRSVTIGALISLTILSGIIFARTLSLPLEYFWPASQLEKPATSAASSPETPETPSAGPP